MTNKNVIFGRPVEKDLEGAKEIVNTWQFHIPSKLTAQKRDFRSLNKKIVRRGMSTSKDFRSFVQADNSMTKQPKEGNKSIAVILPDDEFAYGYANRPSTPLNNLLANVYGAQSTEVTREIYKTRLAESQKKTPYLPKVTKSSLLNQGNASRKLQELDDSTSKEKVFKLKKFDGVRAKIDTVNREYNNTLRSVAQDIHIRSASHDVSRSRRNINL
jgi:hypothetical protein